MKVTANYKYLPAPTITLETKDGPDVCHWYQEEGEWENHMVQGWHIQEFGCVNHLDGADKWSKMILEVLEDVHKKVMDHLQSNFEVFYTPLSEAAAKIENMEKIQWQHSMGFNLNDPDPTVWINDDGLPF